MGCFIINKYLRRSITKSNWNRMDYIKMTRIFGTPPAKIPGEKENRNLPENLEWEEKPEISKTGFSYEEDRWSSSLISWIGLSNFSQILAFFVHYKLELAIAIWTFCCSSLKQWFFWAPNWSRIVQNSWVFFILIRRQIGVRVLGERCFGGNVKERVKSVVAVDRPLGRFGCLLWETLVGDSCLNSSVSHLSFSLV